MCKIQEFGKGLKSSHHRLLGVLRILNPKKIPKEMFTNPSAVRMKFGLANAINPKKIPQKPATRKKSVIIPSLRREGEVINIFIYITCFYKSFLGITCR